MYLGREETDGLRRLDETAMEARAKETLKGLSVTTIRSVRQIVAGLSGGQRQSVAVAKAVMWNSKVVILDEPTAALGVAQTKQVLDLVARLGEQGLAVILISHNLHDIFQVADGITVLRLGQNVAEFRRKETNQQEVVEAITAGQLSKVPGPAGGGGMSAVAAPPPAPSSDAPAPNTVGAYAQRWWTDVKSGELGSLPIFVGLIIIAIVFQTQNDRFLTASNFVNLILQTAPYAVIAMGVTFVLLLGEIDLSIGFVSGVGGVLTAILLTPDGNELPVVAVFAIVFGAGLAIGTLHGLIITKIGVPSFVVTLAGLLAWNGVVLLLIGSRGTVILQNDTVIGLANDFLAPGAAWILAAVCVALYAGVQLVSLRSRTKAGLEIAPTVIVVLRVVGLAVALGVVVAVCNQNRGLPYAAVVDRGPVRRAHLHAQPDEVRAPHLRGRRQRRGGAARGHQRRQRADRVLRAVLAAGGARRHHPRLAPALGRHEHGRRPGAAVPDRRGGHRRHVAVRRPRHDEGRAARRARDALDRQRARPARPVLGHEVRAHGRRAAAGRHGRLDLAPGSRPERQGMTEPLRVGILSTAKINDAILTGARESAGAEVVAVASRDRGRAEAYAAEKGIPRAHGSYEALLADEDVEAVYVPLPNSMHLPWSERALAAGKHVLCEKPLSPRAADVEAAFDAAERAGRILMEAFMWRYHPATEKVVSLAARRRDRAAARRARGVRLHARPGGRQRALVGRARGRGADGRRLLLRERAAAAGGRARARLGRARRRAATASTRGSPGCCASAATCSARSTAPSTCPTGPASSSWGRPARSSRSTRGTARRRPCGSCAPTPTSPRTSPSRPPTRTRRELDDLARAVREGGEPRLGRADAVGQARTIEALYRAAARAAAPSPV